ncbi:proteasome cyclosome repeat family protein [Cryptosporidium andersoni]|uniref:Proteasome cyclosome repeat family protein n=1 Tax=Cryptosporidium andersoni TaxID=117008 RepID=A0A1J4MIL2_9CRYT|nr:proteasome cyclosome repeat family protein [Cryptosporidium andersoni]
MVTLLEDSGTISLISGVSAMQNISSKLTSASVYLALLDEDTEELKLYALEQLNMIVDNYWYEIADCIGLIESCYEDESFSNRELAALLASKVYFHLEDYNEALKYLLSCTKLFDPSENNPYTQCMVVKCVDEFIRVCNDSYKKTESVDKSDKDKSNSNSNNLYYYNESDKVDLRLEEILSDLIKRCTANGNYIDAIGIAIEARRCDIMRSILDDVGNICDSLVSIVEYFVESAHMIVSSNRFRLECYNILIEAIENYIGINKIGYYGDIINEKITKISELLPQYCECLYHTGNSQKLAFILHNLIKTKDYILMGYSIAFLLKDYGNQSLILRILEEIKKLSNTDSLNEQNQPIDESIHVNSNNNTTNKSNFLTLKSSIHSTPLKKLEYILRGDASINLTLQFLYLNNQPDLGLLDYIRSNSDQRSSIIHTALVMSHALMQAGTTCDVFLRNNLEWLGKATHWSRFSTSASLGVIHMGHIEESFKVLSTCLPQTSYSGESISGNNATSSGPSHGEGISGSSIGRTSNTSNSHGGPYSEGGAYYALGLIHANHFDNKIKEYLLNQLHNCQRNEVLQHGLCLGLGLLCMGSCDPEIYDELKSILYMDNAVAGEAATYALGMVMLGSGSSKVISDLLSYAKDTQHEKIVRACSLAMGLVMYQKEEEANDLYFQLNSDNEHFIRYGSLYVLGLAYCGTGNEFALEKLLHSCVSELSDDNRRAAVFALGLVLCNRAHNIPQVFKLLCDSYNPHVRYAAALTLGMTCCGTGLQSVLSILRNMTSDTTDFVRQAAYIGLGFVLMQLNNTLCDQTNAIRQQMIKACTDKHEHVTTRFGAILGVGLLDSGGRNVVASLFSRTGHIRSKSVVGLTLFSQFWYWFPLVHCISLVYYPTALIGITEDIRMPKNFKVKCNASIGMFDYPKPFSVAKSEDKKVVLTAVLSTANKKNKKITTNTETEVNEVSAMTIDDETRNGNSTSAVSTTAMLVDINTDNKIDTISEDKDNTMKSLDAGLVHGNTTILQNPCRVLPAQVKYIEYLPDSRYVPIFPKQMSGFILLRDTKPDEPEEFAEVIGETKDNTTKNNTESLQQEQSIVDEHVESTTTEQSPPQPFEWHG